MKRSRRLRIWLSVEEEVKVMKRVPEGVPIAEWARCVLLAEKIQWEKNRRLPPRCDPRLIGQIGKIGNNLNQLARVANMLKEDVAAQALVDELVLIRAELDAIVNSHTVGGESAEVGSIEGAP